MTPRRGGKPASKQPRKQARKQARPQARPQRAPRPARPEAPRGATFAHVRGFAPGDPVGFAVARCAACDVREVVGGATVGAAVPACPACAGPREDVTPAAPAPRA